MMTDCLLSIDNPLCVEVGVAGGKEHMLHSLRRYICKCSIPLAVVIPPQVTPDLQELTLWFSQQSATKFAVRSSATVEDALDASFAGQFTSILNVSSPDGLLSAIQQIRDCVMRQKLRSDCGDLPLLNAAVCSGLASIARRIEAFLRREIHCRYVNIEYTISGGKICIHNWREQLRAVPPTEISKLLLRWKMTCQDYVKLSESLAVTLFLSEDTMRRIASGEIKPAKISACQPMAVTPEDYAFLKERGIVAHTLDCLGIWESSIQYNPQKIAEYIIKLCCLAKTCIHNSS